jgi:hypothetical protein
LNAGGDLAVVLTGFLAGILGSGHCFGMCGGIAGAFGALAGSHGGRFKPALVFNLGRVGSYVLLGAVMALLLGGTGAMLDIPGWSRALRLATAVMILLIGLRFLFGLSSDWAPDCGTGFNPWRCGFPGGQVRLPDYCLACVGAWCPAAWSIQCC